MNIIHENPLKFVLQVRFMRKYTRTSQAGTSKASNCRNSQNREIYNYAIVFYWYAFVCLFTDSNISMGLSLLVRLYCSGMVIRAGYITCMWKIAVSSEQCAVCTEQTHSKAKGKKEFTYTFICQKYIGVTCHFIC